MKVSLGILWLGLVAVYFQIAGFQPLTYDDPLFLSSHPAADLSLSSIEFWKTIVSVPTANLWHPLTDLSHQLLLRVSPAVQLHLAVNVLIHGMTASFLLLFLTKVTKQIALSLAVVLLFAWHPITVESVAWISGRKDLLCALFLILALRHYYERVSKQETSLGYRLIFLAIAASLSKPIAFTLPFLLLAIDFWPLRRREAFGKLVISKWPLWILSAASVLTTVLVQSSGTQATADHRSFFVRITEGLWALQHGIVSVLVPRNLHLGYSNPSELHLFAIIAWAFLGMLLVACF